ncbi:hypothetical protein GCM10018962_14220 [Dactylosporangium matsuzakiense]|uniref:Uncharacterized protein n=3 Tax=Dactylosporangium matsuzakiense TaxID=53360 RepID=A0A9W6NR63_9ACTN|nr:hypothetical protein GCM10017581_076990 [Dactylosporangium matsuzakiense]
MIAPMPMAELPARVWRDDEWARIKLGYAARDMDEKWNVFIEDQTAFVHRSWTGNGIYEASFAAVDDGGWRICAAVVESEPARYRRRADRHDRVMLELVLSAIVLGEPAAELRAELVALAMEASGLTNVPAGALLRSALGLRTGR